MEIQILEQILAGNGSGLASLTVDQYHRMIATHIFGDETQLELLEGLLVRKDRRDGDKPAMNVGTRHATVVTKLFDAVNDAIRREQACARCQQPITLPPASEPEPDVSVAVGSIDDYALRHPGPSDLVAGLEVADSSLRLDQGIKQRIYANAGIEIYWIVDLSTDQIEVYTQPDASQGTYGQVQTVRPGDSIDIPLPNGKTVAIAVADVLP